MYQQQVNLIFGYFLVHLLFPTQVYSGTHRALINLKTSFGDLIGIEETTDFGEYPITYHSFKGIPYAKPPVGHLRWKEPILATPRTHNASYATNYRSICPQWQTKTVKGREVDVIVGDENCLTINIFVSLPVVSRTRVLLPVLVYIHGGGFMRNGSPDFGPEKFMTQNVILVTFNYRLGVFGYLSTGDHNLPGNYGSLDQITALKWVKKYIKDFGGDPYRVTVFGNSAGAASVHQLLLSPLAKGLFQRAILQSGSLFCDTLLMPNPLEISHKFAYGLHCPTHNGTELMARCLASRHMNDLMREQKKLTKQWMLPVNFAPVVDGHSRSHPVLPDHPDKLPIANQVPIIIGTTRDEGLFLYVNLAAKYTYEEIDSFPATKHKIMPEMLKLILRDYGDEKMHYLIESILHFYPRFRFDSMGAMVEVINGVFMESCFWKTIKSFSKLSRFPVFAYVFGHRLKSSPSFAANAIEQLEYRGFEHPLFYKGIGHQDELFYLFHMTEKRPMKVKDKLVARALTELWSSFATFGNPAPAIRSFGVWPPWLPVQKHRSNVPFYYINLIFPHIKWNFKKLESDFLSRIMKHHSETSPIIKHHSQLSPTVKHNSELSPIVKHNSELSPIVKHNSELSPIVKHNSELSPIVKHHSQPELSQSKHEETKLIM